jgi:hypothetical protein
MHKLSFVVFFLLSLLVEGCVSHRGWVENKNIMIGTKFDPSSNLNKETLGHYTNNVSKGQKFYYRVESESPNVRYFFQMLNPGCRYSLLVAPDSMILSWRFEEVKDSDHSCVVY